jgi:hypothetical protein
VTFKFEGALEEIIFVPDSRDVPPIEVFDFFTGEPETITPFYRLQGAIDQVVITYGRRRFDAPVLPATCQIVLVNEEIEVPGVVENIAIPALRFDFLRVGASITIKARLGDEVDQTRFQGEITDVEVSEKTTTIIAVSSKLSRFNQNTGNADAFTGKAHDAIEAFVEQYETIRKPEISQAFTSSDADVDIPAATNISGTTYIERIVNSDHGSVFFEEASRNVVKFKSGDTRRNTLPEFIFNSLQVSFRFAVSRRRSEKVNSIRVEYTGGDVVVEDSEDVALYGIFPKSVSTVAATENDAILIGNLAVNNLANPDWALDSIEVVLPNPAFDDDSVDLRNLIGLLEVSSVVRVPELFNGAPILHFVEGYRETLSKRNHVIEFFLSDIRLTRPPDRWVDVYLGFPLAENLKWDQDNPTNVFPNVDPALTWRSVLKDPVTNAIN